MRSVHLLVLIHGMWGNPDHLSELARIMTEVKGKVNADEPDGVELETLVAQTNRDESTYDGIDWGGERIADEIYAKAEEIERDGGKLTKFSVTGYSLGGLLARFVIGVLHQRHFFDNVTPVNFNTFATPHIGLLSYPSFISSLKSALAPKLLSRTGEQFYGVDQWSTHGRSLLMVMVDENRVFFQALSLFPQVTFYSNAVNDITVPYATSYIDIMDPFADHKDNGMEIEFDPVYKPLIKSYTVPEIRPPRPRPTPFSAAWFRSKKPPTIIPPRLQMRFPFNLVVYLLVPVLVPAFLTLVVVRLSLSARSSRARIRLLEEDDAARSARLINVVARLEKGVENAVVDMMEDPATDSAPGSGTSTPALRESPSEDALRTGASAVPAQVQEEKALVKGKCRSKGKGKGKAPPEQPILTPDQLTMVVALNALPQLRKELVFIDGVRNSHATIICRDVKNFDFHRRGEGVVRHWADNFVL